MVRAPLTPEERLRGERLGALLRAARGTKSMAEIAELSGVPVETLRKIETGRIPTPAFFTVASLAFALDLTLDQIAGHCVDKNCVDKNCVDKNADPSGRRLAG
jgi:transcriptional regulator with XRE-family HTH domain